MRKVIAWLLSSLALSCCCARAQNMVINSITGPVTATEISSFANYMATQVPDPTPWGALNGTGHNAWADGNSGNALEAFGLMYELSGNVSILNSMISWTDKCVSERNDLMSAANGGQRVMWTGLIDKVWVPNDPTSASAGYAGGENGDTEAHITYCALEILHTPSLWNTTVPDGNPYGYGVTYFQRATNYIGKCDEGNLEYSLQHFIQPGTDLVINPTNWPAGFHTMVANNIIMMMDGDFQRLAECHELLGDNPTLLSQYDAIVNASGNQCLSGMSHPYTVSNQTVYTWYYYPFNTANIENVGHAAYDMVGMHREYNRPGNVYGFSRAAVTPFANALADVMNLGANTFSGNVDGTGTTQNYMQAQWLLLGDWNPAAYTVVATADIASGRYQTTTLMDATILWIKNRIYLEFSITPATTFQTTPAGDTANFPVAVAPLGGFSNTVNLTVSGLPSGASGGFSPSSANLATINAASTNCTLSISTSVSTPPGTYPLSIVGTSGGVSHTNTVTLVVGLFGLTATPASQTVAPGGNGAFTVNVVTNSGFSGTVSLGLSALPANTSAGFSPGSLSGAGSSTLTVTTMASTPPGTYPLTIYGTNGSTVVSATVSLVVGLGNPTWNGGSASGSNWSDAANWGGASVASGAPLAFGGSTRLNNNNDTTAGTSYASLVFNPGAGAFVLGGNPITLGGNVTNYSSNPQTINLGLSFGTSLTLSGSGNTLVIGNGLTNTLGAPGSTTLTLSGAGIITNLLKSASSPGGTNIITLNDPNANWTLVDNASSAGMTVPWVFSVNNGTFNYGTAGSAPTLTLTTPDNTPQDNQVGTVGGAVGTFNMIAGTLTTSSRFNTATASSSTGIINQSGGTWNIGVQFQGANGSNPGEVSVFNQSGGILNVSGGGGQFYVASRGTGTLTVSGAAVLNCGTFDVSRNANGNSVGTVGTVNLNGGTILANKVGTATANSQTNTAHGTSATFNFNGGTLKINSSTTPFFQGSTVVPVIPILAKVQGGGAIIDTNGKTNVFGEPLLHDTIVDPDPDGGLTKNGAGTLVLASNVTYNGNTTINAGSLALTNSVGLGTSPVLTIGTGATLDASGRSDQTLTLVSGQTLQGSGTVLGSVVAVGGSVVSPGSAGSVGLLTTGSSVTLNGTTVMKLNKSGLTNDVLQVGGVLGGSGTLTVTNIAGTLAPGDSFQLFNASSYSVTFTNIVPVIPALNLAWNTNNLGSGTLGIVSSPTQPPRIQTVTLNGAGLVMTGNGGVPGWPYYVLTSTNPALPLASWTVAATNNFDGTGGFSQTNPVNPANPACFYVLQLH